MPSTSRAVVAFGVSLATLLAACAGDDTRDDTSDDPAGDPVITADIGSAPVPPTAPVSSNPAPTPSTAAVTPPTAAAQTLIEVADDRLAFTLALPDENPVINASEHDFGLGPACGAPFWQLEGGIDIEAWPASCDPQNGEPGNGEHGHYRSAADAPSPIDPIDFDTVLGPAEVFGQVYFECTNSCDEWELDVAVITLSEPVDDEYPTLTVIGTDKSYTRDDMLALLESFGAG